MGVGYDVRWINGYCMFCICWRRRGDYVRRVCWLFLRCDFKGKIKGNYLVSKWGIKKLVGYNVFGVYCVFNW